MVENNSNENNADFRNIILRGNKTLLLLLYLFWFGNFFVTVALDSPNLGIDKIFNPVRDFYDTQINRFPGFEVITILLSFVIFLKFIEHYSLQNKKIKIFIIFSFIFIILALLNPKNAFQAGLIEFVTFRITRSLLFFALFSIVILLLNNQVRFYLMLLFFKTGLTVAVIKVSFDLISYFAGLGPLHSYGIRVSTFGGDILVWVGIFQVLTFIIYIYTRSKKYIFFSFLFLLTLILSYERTALFVPIISDALIFLYSIRYLDSLRRKSLYKKATLFSLIILFLIPVVLNTKKGQDLYWRFSSAIQFTGVVTVPSTGSMAQYSDNGHLRQSLLTTAYLLNHGNLFWGGGLNRRDENYLFIYGQSQGGVHNNFVSMWQYFGIPGEIFLFFLIFYFLKIFISAYNSTENFFNFIVGI